MTVTPRAPGGMDAYRGQSGRKQAYAGSVPTAPGGNSDWARAYSLEIKQLIERQVDRSPRSVQVHLGPSELGVECLSGETEVVTRQGIRKIRDLAKEGSAELLVPLIHKASGVRQRRGPFRRVPVECFGEQELYEIVLRRDQDIKTLYATAEHHWYRSYWPHKLMHKKRIGGDQEQERLATKALVPGHRLTPLRRTMASNIPLMPIAVAQGFIFGDGTKGSSRFQAPATLDLIHNGKDEALLPYFPGEHKTYQQKAGSMLTFTRVRGLPRYWKNLPPLDESTSFLLSWLAGYFAADGSVKEGGHCTIASVYEENLVFAQNVAAICGIGYGRVKKTERQGFSGHDKPIYTLSLRRDHLPKWFFLTEKHAERVRALSLVRGNEKHWIVESVRPTGRKELVYCAITGEAGAFALADDLMTGNCHRQIVGKLTAASATNHVPSRWPPFIGTAVHASLAQAFDDENARTGIQRFLTELPVAPVPGHAGTTDLYDRTWRAVVDHKVLGPTSLAKIASKGPSRRYRVQLLLYWLGCLNAGLPAERIALIAYPRAAATLDGLYVWEHVPGPEDVELIREVLRATALRHQLATEVLARRMTLEQVPITPGDDCIWCPLFRPQAARDLGPGCPGTSIGQGSL